MGRSNGEPQYYLSQRVREVLAQHPDLHELEVIVKVAEDRIFVTGKVATAERRELVTKVLEGAFPEQQVMNQTEVVQVMATEKIEKIQ